MHPLTEKRKYLWYLRRTEALLLVVIQSILCSLQLIPIDWNTKCKGGPRCY